MEATRNLILMLLEGIAFKFISRLAVHLLDLALLKCDVVLWSKGSSCTYSTSIAVFRLMKFMFKGMAEYRMEALKDETAKHHLLDATRYTSSVSLFTFDSVFVM